LGDELDDFDEDVERSVARDDRFGSFGEQRIDDAVQPRQRGAIALTLDADHVHPQESVKRFYPRKNLKIRPISTH